ncbi:MAG TPA: UDP-N-acetylmuramoyl-L-alanyl-D-glutamate--2,6-diaminopimelate ligase [Thermodesulfobacteriota bacterium]|nr:UDP-N-acetylmuramoyl-L-alanyl-D-glutamate--2,6-diaminopimelate ligase [Thermodesulfobacteriota bacterium]
MVLRDLIKGVEVKRILGRDDVDIAGISYDSKEVRPGFLFVAIRGEKTDGHKYLGVAIENGARAIVVEEIPNEVFNDTSIIRVEDTKSALAEISANFFFHPTKELTLVGVTGTNGKTTVTYILESIWQEEKKNTGLIGTVEYRFSMNRIPSSMTTPESLDLTRLLSDMRSSGVRYVVMEVSSHALDRKRVLGCHFDAAIFTNLTQDHLDYHETMEDYFSAKKRLFSEVLRRSEKGERFSIINFDDPYGKEIAKEAVGEVVSYSTRRGEGVVYAEKAEIYHDGIGALLNTPWGNIEIDSKLYGRHNLSNILAASATALSLGSSKGAVEAGVSRLVSVPGRLDRVENPLGITVLVDYAHTPDALRNVLLSVRPLTPGNIILVFGCGGDRDPTKRPIMGRIGKELSDILIVTSDNPRGEPPERIIDQIEEGVFEGGDDHKPYFRVPDRRDAIRKAIEVAAKGDTVLIAGKGHENYQILGTRRIHFDDKEVAREVLREIGKRDA